VFEILQKKWITHYYEKSSRINGANDLQTSISVGIYVFHSSLHPSWKNAYQQADQALYTAKNNGRNQIVMVKDPYLDKLLT
jgi:PleD family two-component response regulator